MSSPATHEGPRNSREGAELSPDNIPELRLAELIFRRRFEAVYPLADKVITTAADDNDMNDGYIVAIRPGCALDQEKRKICGRSN
jgi:hypothetical protein